MPQAERRTSPRMDAAGLLQEIADYCRMSGMAESTFGRRAVNDGKFAGRLRFGGRVTHDTVDRVRRFIAANPASPLSERMRGLVNAATAP